MIEQEKAEKGHVSVRQTAAQNGESLSHHDKTPLRQTEMESGKRLLLTLGIWVVLSAAAVFLTITTLNALAGSWTATGGPIILSVAEVYLILILTLTFMFGGPTGLRDRLKLRYTSAHDLLLALTVEALILAAVALVYLALSPTLGGPRETALQILRTATDMSRIPSADPLALGLIVLRVVLLAGLGEELLFMGAIFGWLRQRLSPLLTIVLTAVLFSLAHPAPLLYPFVFVYAIGAGLVREHTGSTLNTMLMHAVNDTLLLVIAFVLVTQYGVS
jgi:membrane protease YdiL (CAAX protease family)